MEWHFAGAPDHAAPGWYAVLVCWDSGEGVFPMGEEWDGAKWKQAPVVAFGDRCETAKEAKQLAYINDPEEANVTAKPMAQKTMTVAELSKALKKYPYDLPVYATWEGVFANIAASNFTTGPVGKSAGVAPVQCLIIDIGEY